MAEVKVSRNQAFIECEDLNEITTKDQIRQDLWFQLGGQVIQKTDILRLRKTYGSTQNWIDKSSSWSYHAEEIHITKDCDKRPNCLFSRQMNDISGVHTTGSSTCTVLRKAINTMRKSCFHSKIWTIDKQPSPSTNSTEAYTVEFGLRIRAEKSLHLDMQKSSHRNNEPPREWLHESVNRCNIHLQLLCGTKSYERAVPINRGKASKLCKQPWP